MGRRIVLRGQGLRIVVRGVAVGWGTALQAERSRIRFRMVSQESVT